MDAEHGAGMAAPLGIGAQTFVAPVSGDKYVICHSGGKAVVGEAILNYDLP
jgi:hypothetical protein